MAILALSLLAVVLLCPAPAAAQCSSPACPDIPAIENVRAVVAAACDCSGAKSHGQYVKCARQIIRSAIKGGMLAKGCKGPVLRCEARSTCGRADAKVCCVVGPKGRVKARQVRGGRCPGTLCENPTSLADACTDTGECSRRRGLRSFRSVQRVLRTSCALSSCHSTFARAGGLVLDSEEVSYRSLVNQPADHPDAAGLLRVKPGDPAASFLVQKLRGLGPGDPMPQSGDPLAEPIVGMIEDWIRRGALSTAEECRAPAPGAESLCDDSEPTGGGESRWAPLPPLEPPAPEEGIQLHIPPRPVASGDEWETCYAIRPGRDLVKTTSGERVLSWPDVAAAIGLPPGQLPTVREQIYRMHSGSHHLLLYAYFGQHPEAYPQGYFPCVAASCVDDADCPPDAGTFTLPIGGTQVAGTRYEVRYPEGVGIPVLGPNSVLIVNPHFTNTFQPAQETYGEAWLNLYFHRTGEFKALLDGIFAVNYVDLFVEPYQTRTISRIWRPRSLLGGGPVDAALFQLFGHMHKRGTEFQIDYVRGGACSGSQALCGRDGDCPAGQTCARGPNAEDTTIYYTTDWDLAPIVDFPRPYFRVSRDEGLRWTCTHTNGVQGDPARPPKKCERGCSACGWDEAAGRCVFTRGVQLRIDAQPRTYAEGEPMPLVFGQLADDEMCNMFGYYINQADLPRLPQ